MKTRDKIQENKKEGKVKEHVPEVKLDRDRDERPLIAMPNKCI